MQSFVGLRKAYNLYVRNKCIFKQFGKARNVLVRRYHFIVPNVVSYCYATHYKLSQVDARYKFLSPQLPTTVAIVGDWYNFFFIYISGASDAPSFLCAQSYQCFDFVFLGTCQLIYECMILLAVILNFG